MLRRPGAAVDGAPRVPALSGSARGSQRGCPAGTLVDAVAAQGAGGGLDHGVADGGGGVEAVEVMGQAAGDVVPQLSPDMMVVPVSTVSGVPPG